MTATLSPPTITSGDVPPPLDASALRARLAAAEASLSQTRLDLSVAQRSIAARDASPPPPQREAAARGGNEGGTGVDGGTPSVTIPPTAAATGIPPIEGEAVGASFLLDGRTPADYEAAADLAPGSDVSDDYRGFVSGARVGPRGGARLTGYTDEYGYAEGYNDGFDRVVPPGAGDWLQAFDIPRAILRSDGMPGPFSPDDGAHNATFTLGSRDDLEARHWYCILAWTQQLFNEVLSVRHAPDATEDRRREVIDYLTCALRRLYALGVSRYDYLALRQTEPALAEAFSNADAVPRNTLRGDGARRYVACVARQDTLATAKLGAAERGFAYPKRGGRRSTGSGGQGSSFAADAADTRGSGRGRGGARGTTRGGRGRGPGRA